MSSQPLLAGELETQILVKCRGFFYGGFDACGPLMNGRSMNVNFKISCSYLYDNYCPSKAILQTYLKKEWRSIIVADSGHDAVFI
jgi:hypothetical protein